MWTMNSSSFYAIVPEDEEETVRGLPYMTSALKGDYRKTDKEIRSQCGQRVERVKNSNKVLDVLYGSPLTDGSIREQCGSL